MTLSEIAKLICAGENVTIDDIRSKKRQGNIVFARHLIMYFSYLYSKHAYSYIGNYFGGKDHATVIHARKCINNYLETDKFKKRRVEQYEEELLDISRNKGMSNKIGKLEDENIKLKGRVKELEDKIVVIENNIDTFVKELKL